MFGKVRFRTNEVVGNLPLVSYRYSAIDDKFRKLEIVFAEDEHDCIVFTDSDLPQGSTYEIRGDGIWADTNCEIPDGHWSFSLESFALRVRADEYLAYKDTEDGLLIGDRIAFGYELDLISLNGQDWLLSGEVFVEKSVIDIKDIEVTLSLK